MATKTKNWSTGTGSATIQYDGQGDGQITITSDPNNVYEARSMQITIETTDGSDLSKTLTINQAAKQRIDISNAIVTASNQTYSGSAKTPTPTVTLNGSTVPSSGYDVAYSNNTNAGTATITITGKGDYTGTAYGTFTINKATPTYTAPTARSLTYSGSAQYLTTTGSTSHGTIQYSSDGTNWYTTRRQGTNAGSYTTYWRLIGDSNHNDITSTSISATIAKASRTISFTSYPSSLNVGESGSLSASPSAGSGDGTISFSSSSSSIASVSGSTVYGNAEGSCTIYASISEGSNYLAASTSYSLSVISLFVDLGLPSGLKWARGNIAKSGSSYYMAKARDYGCWFSWGNIIGHNQSENYNWGTSTYNSTPGAELTGDIQSSDSDHDAARAHFGSPWRLPTKDDWQELYDNTNHQWTTYNGVNGRKFIKKTDSSVFIFIPAAGYGNNKYGIINTGTECRYWASNMFDTNNAYMMYSNSSSYNPQNRLSKHCGFTIRAVKD